MILLKMAAMLAGLAHFGTVDKNGKPYILHPVRVIMAVEGEDAKVVAILHDVLEDCDVSEALLRYVLPGRIVEALVAISKLSGEPLDHYYGRVLANPLALAVKLADVCDNLARVPALPNGPLKDRLNLKYNHALAVLASQ